MTRFIFILCAIASAAFGDTKPLRLDFGVYQSDRATVMYRKFTPILEAIQYPIEQLIQQPVDIHLTIFEDYESGIKALAKGEVDFVRFGPASYILAEQQNPKIQLLAMEQRKGLIRFNGLIIARADAGIKELKDVKGKSFAFGDVNSTIGRFLSQAELLDASINAEDLTHYAYLGRHDLVANAVISGSHDAGALKESTYSKLCDPKKIKVIHTFENVTKPWVAREGLEQPIQEAITKALRSLHKPEVLGELGCSGFVDATPEDYDTIREGMKKSETFIPKKETPTQE
ncbi:MAG TPA: PhnD/SsuA/transferrin family substrate-binding protein [Phycisphaerales bacterium]|jgi:phosphonate transport system substrate-binding protein|nr:PhnD/SsuA/transferrin family substrate-binding protein [Phycisphaerales bacterium]